MSRQLLKLQEIADRTGIPLATLRWYRSQAKRAPALGPPTFKLGRRVVGYADECDAWVAEQRRAGVTGGGPVA